MSRLASILLPAFVVCVVATTAHAAGPLVVNGAALPLAWTTQPIPYNPDRGTLGLFDEVSGPQFVAQRFATWAAVEHGIVELRQCGLAAG